MLRTEPLISIIVPVYNTEKYLEECIDSIRSQTYQNIEIVLIDDGSSDRSSLICDEYAKKDSRIKLLHKENGGLCSSRNVGIGMASGEFLTFVDCDDKITDRMVEELYQVYLLTGCDIIQCKTYAFLRDEKYERKESGKFQVLDKREGCMRLLDAKNKECGVTMAKLYKKKVFAGIAFPEEIRYADDISTVYRIFWNADRIAFTESTGYLYRSQRPGSIMHSAYSFKKWEDKEKSLKERAEFFKEKQEMELYAMALYCYGVSIVANIPQMKAELENPGLPLQKLKCDARKTAGQVLFLKGVSIGKKVFLFMRAWVPWIHTSYVAIKKRGYERKRFV